jgi:alpha-beta hydrolase superfamily lysophospholipase
MFRFARRGLVPVLCLALLAAGCAPQLAPPGPGAKTGLTAPRLTPDHLIASDGLALPLRAWLPEDAAAPRAVILALHGFNFYSEIFEEPAAYWAAHGIATYAYDQRGFGAAPHPGRWAGTPAMISDVTAAARGLRARYPGVPLFLLGDSMGGAVILAALGAAEPPPHDGVILVAPAVWARSTLPLPHRLGLWIGAHTVPWLKLTGGGLGIQASDNIEMLRELGRDPLVIKETRIDAIHGLVDLMDAALAAAPRIETRVLLLYGAMDEVVPEGPSLQLWRDLPEAARDRQRRALYENGWHMLLRDLEAEVVLDDIAQWIADPNSPLPSGAEAKTDPPGN